MSKNIVSVYTLPPGSKPIVRVECHERTIKAEQLFKICCDTIGLYERSRKLFGLFRGLLNPVKKYGSGDSITLPVKSFPVSIQRWMFDVTIETKLIKTDPVALKLLAFQYMSDLELSRKQPNEEQLQKLKELDDPDFPCHKQYVEYARTIHDYDWATVQGIEVVNKVKLVTNILQKGSKVELACTPKKLIIIAKSFDLAIPWRKIRRFAEINETKTISFEILLDSKAFTWIELKTIQGTYLLQLVAEYIDAINEKNKKPEFKQPKWVTEEAENDDKGITFKMIKDELFGKKKSPKELAYQEFHAIDVTSSDEDEEKNPLRSKRNNKNNNSSSSSSRRRSSSITSQTSKKYNVKTSSTAAGGTDFSGRSGEGGGESSKFLDVHMSSSISNDPSESREDDDEPLELFGF